MRAHRVFIIILMLVCQIVFQGFSDNPVDQKKNVKLIETQRKMLNKKISDSVNKGVEFLLSRMNDKGQCLVEFHGKKFPDPGITSLVLVALSKAEYPGAKVKDAMNKGAAFLAALQKPDGGIYLSKKAAPPTYVTSVAVLALNTIDKKKYNTVIEKAQKFLVGVQGTAEADKGTFGGFSYGTTGADKDKADVSATSYALAALKESGYKDSEALKRAVAFLNRCQNDSETNDLPLAGNDGGFAYSPLSEGENRTASYGTMTYSGVKSYIYAGLSKDDVRVERALEWIRKNYTVDKNPGLKDGNMGLFYYFQVMGKTLSILGVESIKDTAGVSHDWKRELSEKIISMQAEDGSWKNMQSRWFENVKPLVTAYSVVALSYCRK